MPFVCDQGYIRAFSRLCETIPDLIRTESADPDLLAKLYEKNMAAADKKFAGAFYTPPEIVRFMCRESLANYISNYTGLSFDNMIAFINEGSFGKAENQSLPEDFHKNICIVDDALANVRAFDPSVGCGAFALGILDEIARLRGYMTPYISVEEQTSSRIRERTPARLLLDAAQNSIFAADIDPVAVEITRLRLWHRLAAAFDLEMSGEGMPSCSSFEGNVKCADSLLEYDARGFDIVIGNPPYISAVESARNRNDVRQALRKKFPQLTGAFDIYTAFLLDGIEKTNDNGVFCWIIPNKFLVSQYAAPVFEHLKQNGLQQSISVSDMGVFAGVGVYPIILTGNKTDSGDRSAKYRSTDINIGDRSAKYRSTDINIGELQPVARKEISSETVSQGYTEFRAETLKDLSNRTFYLKSKPRKYSTFSDHNIKIASGTAGFQAMAIKRYICENPYKPATQAGKQESLIPFVVSGCIDRYSIKYDKVRYMGTTYDTPYIVKGSEIAESKWNLWLGDKICIAGLTKEIEAYYSCRPLALGVGTYAVYDFGDIDPLFLLGLLNSRFMSWYINDIFFERHLSGKYLAINKSTLEQLPLAYADRQMQELIGLKAKRLLILHETMAKAHNRQSECLPRDCVSYSKEIRQLNCDIDEMVYELYCLDKKEINAIEHNSQANCCSRRC